MATVIISRLGLDMEPARKEMEARSRGASLDAIRRGIDASRNAPATINGLETRLARHQGYLARALSKRNLVPAHINEIQDKISEIEAELRELRGETPYVGTSSDAEVEAFAQELAAKGFEEDEIAEAVKPLLAQQEEKN